MPNKPNLNKPTTPPPDHAEPELMRPLRLTAQERRPYLNHPSIAPDLKRRLRAAGEWVNTIGVTLDEISLLFSVTSDLVNEQAGDECVDCGNIGKIIELFALNPLQIENAWKRERVFQFTIVLRGDFPTIWRTIQVKDCPLDRLARLFAAAMGWGCTNSHRIEVDGQTYVKHDKTNTFGFDLDFFEVYRDEAKVKISQLYRGSPHATDWIYVQGSNKSGRHDVWFEGPAELDRMAIYPRCIAGKHAGPPRHCWDADDYAEFMKARHLPVDERPKKWRHDPSPYVAEGFDATEVDLAMSRPPSTRRANNSEKYSRNRRS